MNNQSKIYNTLIRPLVADEVRMFQEKTPTTQQLMVRNIISKLINEGCCEICGDEDIYKTLYTNLGNRYTLCEFCYNYQTS